MPDSNEPKKETVRIAVSAQPAAAPSTAMPAGATPASPEKETARIAVLPDPPTKPAVQMKKTQPLIDLPPVETPATTVSVRPEPQRRIQQIPIPLCWALLAASAAVLILQIWNYLS